MYRRKPALPGIAAALLCALLASGCLQNSDDSSDPDDSQSQGADRPSGPWRGEMKVVTDDAKTLKEIVASHRGKVVVIDVWNIYCPPCVKELPELAKLQKKYGNKIVCIAVDVSYEGGEDPITDELKNKVIARLRDRFGKVLTRKESLGADFTLFISSEADDDLAVAVGYEDLPTIFVYSKSGKRMKFDFDGINANLPKGEKKSELSYEKHINPVVEKLLKEP